MSIEESTDEFMRSTLRDVAGAVRASMGLNCDTSDESDENPQYAKVLGGLSLKVLSIVQNLINKQDGKGNLLDTGEKKAIEDKFNILVEVNDRLLDKCNNLISIIENPEVNKGPPVVVVEYTNENTTVRDGKKMTPSQTIKLVSSIQIERPQLKFSKLPDNSKIPFRPLLTKKPNALVPLIKYDSNDDDSYIHPYEYELENLEIPIEQMKMAEFPIIPKSLEDTPYVYVDTIDSLSKIISTLKDVSEIAVDVEHHSMRTYMGLTCLLQISTRSTDYVIDTLALHGKLECLNEVFTNPRILKVFHGSNSDVMWLQRDLGVYVVNMFDSGQACTVLNMPRKSLSYLLEKYCQVKANKEFQRLTDWRIRPLIAELIEYARTDTHYLLYIYDRLKNELLERGQLNDVLSESKKLCMLLYHKPIVSECDSMDLYKKSNEQFNARQMYALKRLWELRDNIARDEDESPAFILPNRLLLTIAQVLPREPSGVLACCSQDWKLPLLRKYVYDFQKICLEAYNESMSHENRKIVQKKNILERLLCRHDLSVVKEKCALNLNLLSIDEQVAKGSGDILFKNKCVSVVPEEMKVLEVFLQCHPIIKETVSESEPMALDDDKSSTCIDTDADINIDLTENNITDTTCDETEVSVVEEMFIKPSKLRKIQDITPFDYNASVKQLMNESKKDTKVKSFNPLKTKKFAKNTKEKK